MSREMRLPALVLAGMVSLLLAVGVQNLTGSWIAAGIALLVVLAAVGTGAVLWLGKRAAGPSDFDELARRLPEAAKFDRYDPTSKAMVQDAGRLRGVDRDALAIVQDIGYVIGSHVPSGRPLAMGFEGTATMFAGPRSSKTTTVVIPWMVGATGPVLVTGNKPDIWTHTALIRAARGSGRTAWLFDPLDITREGEATMWADLIGYVQRARIKQKAAKDVADWFVSGTHIEGAKVDDYFNSAAHTMLGQYILAAAVAGGDIVHVYEWINDDTDRTAATLLEQHGWGSIARELINSIEMTERQKAGLYGMARNFVDCLGIREYQPWVTPRRRVKFVVGDEGELVARPVDQLVGSERVAFDPVAFVQSKDTLYLLSEDGVSAPAPMLTAVAGMVIDAAKDVAAERNEDRLPEPLLAVLDEAANICRLKDLPSLASFSASRGINLAVILQSNSQASRVWNNKEVDELWQASSLRIYGGSLTTDDAGFLERFSAAAGQYQHRLTTSSWSGASPMASSSSESFQLMPKLPVNSLVEMPDRRMVVIFNRAGVAIVKTTRWFEDKQLKDLIGTQILPRRHSRESGAGGDAAAESIRRWREAGSVEWQRPTTTGRLLEKSTSTADPGTSAKGSAA